jgi:hypothetical protein
LKKLALGAVVTMLVLVPANALAQVPLDLTETPERDYGGPFPWAVTIAVLIFGLLMLVAVVLGYMRWTPVWARGKAGKSGPGPAAEAPVMAAVIEKPKVSVAAEAAAAGSAESIGEKAHAVEEGAVPVADEHSADAPSGEDVYQKTLDELLAKGVPQKVAEARAKVAAKKAGG